MCGISGIVDLENKNIQPGLLLAMNKAIEHRGSDDEGYVLIDQENSRCMDYSGDISPSEIKARIPLLALNNSFAKANIGLSHRRFSIIDLSASGHQPLFDKDRTCCVVVNGEIYNYIEVRDELINKGIIFHTQSDTEVLLEAYKFWGTDSFRRLNGFWAIAIYDFKKKRLLLSRDRIGKKPLYWTKIDSRIYFASEIKALLQIPEVHRCRRVNEKAIYHWLVHGLRDLDFTTCFEGIYSLPSGCWSLLDRNFPNDIKLFWKVPDKRITEKDISTAEAAKQLRNILEDAVRIRLRADVPFSVELSGGMDSSALAALAAQNYSGKITTYTVKFPDKEWNEEPFARLVSEHCNTDYKVLESTSENFWTHILAFTRLEEEPYHLPNLQTHQEIWSYMRSMGAKVSLNGIGGDENFAGYGGCYDLAQRDNLAYGKIVSYIRNAILYSEADNKAKNLLKPLRGAVKEIFKKFMPDLRQIDSSSFSCYQGKSYPFLYEAKTLSQLLHSNMTNTLMPYWLRAGDKGCMGIPLEVRAPFLDFRVIDFAFKLPTAYLIRDGWHKWILRKSLEDILPADALWRKKKMGFPFPYERFYRDSKHIVDIIFEEAKNPYLDMSNKESLKKNWRVISFILWYELFFNKNIELFIKIGAMSKEKNKPIDHGFTPAFITSCESC